MIAFSVLVQISFFAFAVYFLLSLRQTSQDIAADALNSCHVIFSRVLHGSVPCDISVQKLCLVISTKQFLLLFQNPS